MNHIKKLQADSRGYRAEIAALQNGLTELVNYVTSSKFSCNDSLDGYVNVKDILARVADIRRNANEVANGYSDIYGPRA